MRDEGQRLPEPCYTKYASGTETDMWAPQERRRARWIGGVLVVGSIALSLYASALAAFQMGGSCKEFGFSVPDWNCRQASFYVLFSILMFVAGLAAIGISFLRRRR